MTRMCSLALFKSTSQRIYLGNTYKYSDYKVTWLHCSQRTRPGFKKWSYPVKTRLTSDNSQRTWWMRFEWLLTKSKRTLISLTSVTSERSWRHLSRTMRFLGSCLTLSRPKIQLQTWRTPLYPWLSQITKATGYRSSSTRRSTLSRSTRGQCLNSHLLRQQRCMNRSLKRRCERLSHWPSAKVANDMSFRLSSLFRMGSKV